MYKLFLFCLSTLILPIEISSAMPCRRDYTATALSVSETRNALVRDYCGKDYTAITLPELVRIYRKSYVAAGFKVINQDLKNTNATLRIRFLKKGSKFHQDLEYIFTSDSGGAINACGSVYDSRELSGDDSDFSERYVYINTLSKVEQKALNKIEKEISARK